MNEHMNEHMKEAERLVACLRASLDDPMWADHSEISKATLRAAIAHIQRGVPDGWKEATIAWEVCASIHREYAKKKDPFFTTRQADFMRHAEAARAALRGEEK